MLFRRVKDHVQKENWFAVLIDFAIVVLGIIIGFQITEWNKDRSQAQEYARAIDRYKSEAQSNLDYLDTAEENFLPYFEKVPEALDLLRTCEDSPENLEIVEFGINRLRGTWSIRLQTQALMELRRDPVLLSQQSSQTRAMFIDLDSKLGLLHQEADFSEKKPLEDRTESNPILRLGELKKSRPLNYNGVDFSRRVRKLHLNVPVSEACQNDQLLKSFYTWEKWQGVLPMIITQMRAEILQSLEALEE